CARDQSGLDSW
nr:immunoglobulin heavy chain junction region [Macaca mulatta]MOV35665.1 immunoglobulin heavy chain junction region [Macaca mulatta]MOV35705.1 immunoglobulin heavy chain junction region [Macaca mulatta]MOV35716.1 immunoglobulin heavy chain junction region [Macaca mulatta]